MLLRFAAPHSTAIRRRVCMSSMPLPRPAERVSHFAQDVWSIFSSLSVKHGACNLGQGFMDFSPPSFVKNAAKLAVDQDAVNQYSPPKGRLRLRNALAERYTAILKRGELPLDPETEVVVAAGANEGIYATLAAYVNPGDEVIMFEPYFDQYHPNVTMNGGVPVYVPLRLRTSAAGQGKSHSSDWYVDMAELESKVTGRTRVIILNTPHNPVGKVFTRDELEAIGDIAERHNLLIISDEVYDALVYAPATHVPTASIPRLWPRTVTVGSIGKTFGVTGWRVGWLLGPEHLLAPALAAQTRIVFCTNGPLQEAAAEAFEVAKINGFFPRQLAEYERRRGMLVEAIQAVGLPYTHPDGSYFVLVDTSRVRIPDDFEVPEYIRVRGANYIMCYWLCTHIRVTAIPVSEFYSPGNAELASSLVRFAFCKKDEVLIEAARRLQRLKEYMI